MGVLYKESEHFKRWDTRYWRLERNKKLAYWHDERKITEPPRDVFPFCGAMVRAGTEENTMNVVLADGRQYRLKAEDEMDYRDWMEALRLAARPVRIKASLCFFFAFFFRIQSNNILFCCCHHH